MPVNDEQLEALLRAAGRLDEPAVRLLHDLPERVRSRRNRNVRRRRRLRGGAILAAGYLAGLATMWAWNADRQALADRQQTAAVDQSVRPAAAEARPLAPSDDVARPRERDPAAHPERAVVFPRISPYESLRRLGDEYLHGRGDVATALVFYRRALDEASQHELTEPDDGDTWLLRSLKRDRLASSHRNDTGEAT